LSKPTFEFTAGSHSVGQEIECSFTHTHIRIVIEEMMTAVFCERVSDSESIPFESFQGDLKWLITVGVDEHLESSRSERLNTGN
jgi:hypothetical protein